MYWLDKIKTYHSFAASALFHILIVAILLKIFSSENSNLNFASQVQPVAVISGSEFESIKTKFFKKNKKSIVTKLDKTSNMVLSQNETQERRKGSKDSNLKDGLNLNLSAKNGKNYNNSYVNLIANKIEQNKSYISMSLAPEDIKTKVMLKVKLDKNGSLNSYKIVENSNYNFFNKAAIKILELSAPFPKPPSDSILEFNIPILFDTV